MIKKLKVGLLIIILLIPGIPVAQSLDNILQKHREAHQQEFWDQLQTVFAQGQWHSEHGWLNVEILIKKPNKFLVRNLGMKMAESFDGLRAWTWGPWTSYKVEEMESEQGLKMSHIFWFGTPLAKMDSLKYLGIVENDNIPCYWIEFREKNRRTEYFISKKTNLLYKSILTDTWDYDRRIVTRTVSKYRTMQGISIPSVIVVKTENYEDEYVLEKIVLGENIRDNIFTKSN